MPWTRHRDVRSSLGPHARPLQGVQPSRSPFFSDRGNIKSKAAEGSAVHETRVDDSTIEDGPSYKDSFPIVTFTRLKI